MGHKDCVKSKDLVHSAKGSICFVFTDLLLGFDVCIMDMLIEQILEKAKHL